MTDAIHDTLAWDIEGATEGRAALEDLTLHETPEVRAGASALIAWLDAGAFPAPPRPPAARRDKSVSWRRLLGR